MSNSTSPPPRGYVSPDWPNPNGDGDAPIIIYGYVPSFALTLTGVILFSISTLLHIFQLLRYRTWWFTPLPIATTMEVIGYICRSLSAKVNPYHVIFFVLQYFFIVVAPVFISACVYLCLSKLIEATGARSPLGFSRVGILVVFIFNDVVSTVLQVTGAAMIGSSESNGRSPDVGNNILLGGLAYQVFSFTVWLCLYVAFLLQFRRGEDRGRMTSRQKVFCAALMVAAIMVYLRTIFRLAETSEGVYGHLMVTEGFFIGLEFAPVVVAVYVLNIWHPGAYLRKQ